MKKLKLNTAGLEGDQLKFVNALNEKFGEMPDIMSPDDIKSEMNKIIKETLKELFGADGKVNVKFIQDIDDLKKMIDGEGEESFKSILKAQGDKIDAAIKRIGSSTETKSIQEAILEKKAEIEKVLANKTGSVKIELKVAAVTTIAGSVTNSISAAAGRVLGDGPIFDVQRGTPFILDFVNVGRSDSPVLIWWDEEDKEGDFQITAEGVAKPLNQYKFERKSANYKKAAGYTVMTDEFMNDLPQLETSIRRLMEVDCMLDINDQLLADILAIAPLYTLTSLNGQILNPDKFAAIGAAICQIQSLYFNPNVLVLNPADAWAMKLIKDDNGRYQMPPFAFNGNQFEFGNVITSPLIDAGNFLIGDGKMYDVDMKGDLIVRTGYNGNDLITNELTLLVEQYFFSKISSNRIGALCYGNFDTIIEAIAKP
jgi:hypothetical protein